PRPGEDADRLAGRSLRATRNLARGLRAHRASDPDRRLLHHPGEFLLAVGLEPLEETEAGAKGRRELSEMGGRPHQRERLEAEAHRPGPAALAEDHVRDPVLERRVEALLAEIVQPVDLIDQDELAFPETAQERDQLIGIADVPREDLLEPRPALRGEEPRQGSLPQSLLTADEGVPQGLAPLLRGARPEEEVLDDGALADEVSEAIRQPPGKGRGRSRILGGRRCFGELQKLRQVSAIRTEEEGPLGGAPLDLPLEGPPLGGGELGGEIVER